MSKRTLPASLDGKPAFEEKIPITRPTIHVGRDFMEAIQHVLTSGKIVNGAAVERFERAAAEYLGVKHAIAVSSCTSGLMLVLKAFQLKGEVILPSFTFAATGHALLWNQLCPRFVDVSRGAFNLDIQRVEAAITVRTKAILAVHVFGNPCEIEDLESLAKRNRLKLIFDAAHAFGSLYGHRRIGTFGDAEVFSLSPTKLVVAGEGGLVTTHDDALARRVRIGRDYGNPGNYDCEFPGLSARMPEFNALLALRSLERLETHVERRNRLSGLYRSLLRDLPGLSFQEIPPHCRTTVKDFAVVIDGERYGMTRDHLRLALEEENITTRTYFDPPLHRQRAYDQYQREYTHRLPVTEEISRRILCLPIFSHMEQEIVEKICEAIRRIHQHNEDIVTAFARSECAQVA